ncbi:unnamed protein product, partial [Phaeothamnion confervicola]
MCMHPGGAAPRYVSVWLALDDATEDNGCLWMLPAPLHPSTSEAAAAGPGEAPLCCLEVRAGDAVVFHSELWHRSGPNGGSRLRR